MNEAKQEPAFLELTERHIEQDELPYRENIPENQGQSILCSVCRSSCSGVTPDNLVRCSACNHTFQADLTVTVSYDADYAHQYDRLPVKEMSDLRWKFIQSCLNLAPGSRVLDVGYGNGAFLKRARAAGMDIFGIDVHTEDFGIPVVDLETKISFDLISFFDSLEHFPSFVPLLELRSKNVIVSIPETPDFILEAPRRWRHYKPGEHLHYFSHRSLDTFMTKWGFQRRLAQGYPEDRIRGKLSIDGKDYDNIYTAIYSSAKPHRTDRS